MKLPSPEICFFIASNMSTTRNVKKGIMTSMKRK